MSATIIGLITFGLFLLPFLFISKSKKKKNEKFIDDLMDEAKKADVTIADKDLWNDSIIGIDDKAETIIFIDESRSEKDVRVFNMNDVKSVRFFPDISKKNPNPDYKPESKLGITFFFKESSKSEVNLVFYMAGFGSLTKQERELFEKWTDRIRKIKSSVL